MKPFNLERALAGAPVVTRNGTPVTELYWFKTANEISLPIVAVVNGMTQSFRLDGTFSTPPSNISNIDLFMAPIKRVGWIVKHNECDAFLATPCIYNSENDAKTHIGKCGGNYKMIKIEWEE